MPLAKLLLTVASLALAAWVAACTWSRIVRAARVPGPGRVAKIGSLVTHVSIIVVIAGGLWMSVAGLRRAAPAYLAAGGELEVPEGGFSVRVDEAWTEFADSGMPVEYASLVTVLEDGREVRKHRIEVNQPLLHNGVGLYQLEMLPSATTVEDAVLEVVPMGASQGVRVRAPFGQEVRVAGTALSVKVLAFYSDFTYDIERRTAALKSIRHENPAVLVQVGEAGEVVGERWVFAAFPGHEGDTTLPCRLFLADYTPDYRHGLTRFEISRQPGAPLLYAGFVAMSVGLALVFWFRVPLAGARGRKSEA